MKSTVRAFVAIDIAPGIRREARKLIKPLQKAFPNVKWVDDDNFHVTLKFLGANTPTTELHRVIRAIERACAKFEQFDLVFDGLGAFPDPSNPRTVWIGVAEGVEELRELSRRIEDELEKIGFPKEGREFSPHLTVGRVKERDRNGGEFESLSEMIRERAEAPIGCSPVDSVVLYSSELERGGPKYQPLAEIELSPFGTELKEKYRDFEASDYDDPDFEVDDSELDGSRSLEARDAKLDVEALDAEVEGELRAICGDNFAKKPKKFNPAPVGGKPNLAEQKKRLASAKKDDPEMEEIDLSEFGAFRDAVRRNDKGPKKR